jgi:hypothetical protein
MTDFLDRLEDDLRIAAQRRGRRRQPVRALKLVAATAAVALLVVAGVRVADRVGADEEAAQGPQISREHAQVAVVSTSDQDASNILASRLAKDGFEISSPRTTAPSDLPSMVLYRPGAERVAGEIGERLGIDDVRALTAEDEALIDANLRRNQVVVIFGDDLQDRMIEREGDCQGAGGYLRLCSIMSEDGILTAFYYGNDRVDVEGPPGVGHWRWAALAPDERTVLAQWSAGCEVPQAYLFDRGGGEVRQTAFVSEALGWTEDGKAIVFVPPDRGCGGADEPGVYLFSADGEESELVTPGERTELKPSVEPRPSP